MIRDPQFDKAIDFTTGRPGESQVMKLWLQGVLVGELRLAASVLDEGLLAEHYRSLLPADLSEATQEQRDLLEEQTRKAEAAQKRLRDKLDQKDRERDDFIERPNAP